ncbi:uncharacterized protein PSANT_03004 [Moesziomyces antarcticus]|uniref:Uncharacterized protein n=1 Tax=Pseudozyma antarctica TaxID=84753 RepID=A0A5C3FLR1_PSEA2|nr:uncharacterized protein PSANT_03004 [Moesziomyces antarcticus]
MSGPTQGYPKSQASVPPKPTGHDERPIWSRMANTTKRFMKRDPQLAPLAVFSKFFATTLKARDTPVGKPLHAPVKPNTHGVPSTQPSARQGAYHAEPHSPRGLAPWVLPHLSEQEKAELESVPEPRHVGAFGKTMKQAAVLDQKRHQESVDAARDEAHNEVPVRNQST